MNHAQDVRQQGLLLGIASEIIKNNLGFIQFIGRGQTRTDIDRPDIEYVFD